MQTPPWPQVNGIDQVETMSQSTERLGIEAAIAYLDAEGHDPVDVSAKKRGYDLYCRHCPLRFEVKASRGSRQSTGLEPDIRTCVWPPVAKSGNIGDVVVVVREGLPFDILIEVCRLGTTEPELYVYPRKVVEESGEFRLKPIWHFSLEDREPYKRPLPHGSPRTTARTPP